MSKSKPCFSFYKIITTFLFFGYLYVLSFPLQIYAQASSEKGLPFITNYSAKTYNTLPQTWSIQEDERGVMYFGVQNYMLEYDGVKWRKITIKNNEGSSVIRSMAKHKDGLIYYGAFGDVGYLDYDSLGQKQTYSLRDFIPAANRDFLDVWTTHATESAVYFQSREYIFRLDDKKPGGKKYSMMKVWKPQTKFMYAFYLDGNYYVHQQGLGLYKMENDSLVLIPGSEFLGKERMQIMLPYKTAGNEKQYLVGLFYSGLYLFNGKTFQPFASQADPVIKTGATLYKGLQLRNGHYVLSTAGKGIVIIDAQGNMQQKINRDVGLQDESIYVPYEDKKGTLWLGMDNGISRVEIASPLTKFTLQSGINTGVLAVTRFQDNLYIGTSNGLLAFDKTTSFFNMVSGIPLNQVFALYPNGNKLLVPGDGLFSVKDKKAVTIRSSISGDLSLTSLKVPDKFPNILLGGGNFGVAVFNKIGVDGFNFAGYVPGITDQIWSFGENKDGTIWAGTQAGLVYHVALAVDEKGNIDFKRTSFKKYGIEQGYKKGLGQVYTIKGINYFIADSSLYTFDDKAKRFIPDSTFGHFNKGGGNTEFEMVEDDKGRVWIRFGKDLRIAYPKPEGGYRFDNTLLSSINELTIQKIFTEKNGIVWLCTTDGLIRYDENIENNNDKSFKTILRIASAGKNFLSTIINTEKESVAVSYKNNSLRFEYAAPFFEQEEKTEYQTWLEGFEKDWSAFDNNYYKEYTNLPTGDYHFHVRAKNIYQQLSEQAVYNFSINPPWYKTWWAYLLYAIVALAILYTIVKWRTHQLHEKHRELEKIVTERTGQLSQRVEELAVINSVQEGLVREMDMEGIYELVGEKIREIFNAQVIDIVTYDRSANLIEDKYAYEKGDRTLLKPRLPKGFRKHVIDTGHLLMINENVEEVSHEFDNQLLIGEMPKSNVFVPMIVGEEVKGIISLQNMDKEHAFTEADVNLLTTLANSMSVALESARLFDETSRLLKETEQRTAELSVINSVQEGLVREMDMKGIYKLVGDRLCTIFPDSQTLVIRTFDHEAGLENFHYTVENGEHLAITARPLIWESKQLISTKKPLDIEKDYEAISIQNGGSAVTEGLPVKSAVFVPMIVGEQVKGSISLQNVDRENAFTESDIRLLTTLTNSMSVALENARLFDETSRLLKETEQRTAELAVINSVQEGLAKELDMQAIYELVGNKIQKVFNAQAVLICTFDHEKKMEYFNYHIEKGEISYPAPRSYDKLREYLIESKEKIYINDHNETTAAKYNMKVVPGTELPKSILFVPLISGDKVRSYVSLQNIDSANAFSESDVRLLETLANSMSVALENARLFDETSRLLKETEQRTAELAVINSVQEGLAKELDMQGIYNLVGDRVQKLFNAQGVIIASLDIENKIEHFNYLFENGEKVSAESRLFNKVRQLLIDKKQSIYISTEEQHIEYGAKAIAGTKMTKSGLFVPLLTGNIIRGYVSLQNIDTENAFSESDIRLLETLANSMSVALENARLFDETSRLLKETEQRTAELAVINSVQEGLAKELDVQGIYDLVGDRVQNLFQTQAVIIASLDLVTRIEHFNYVFESGQKYMLDDRPFNKLREDLIDKKQTIYIETEDIARNEYGITAIGATKMPRSLMFVPLLSGNTIKGYVSIQNIEKDNAFNETDIRLLETLANSMSVALENARLFDETNRLLKVTEMRQDELATINSVQEELVREMNTKAIYTLVGNKICELFDSQTLVIRTFGQDTGLEYYHYAIEKGTHLTIEPRPIIWASKQLIQTKQPLLINKNYVETAKKFGGTGVGKGLPPKSALFVPMIVGDVVKGSVSLQNVDREDAFNEADLRILTTLTNSMSVAIENARLFDETTHLLGEAKQRAAELGTVNSISKALASQLNADDLIMLVGDQLKELFRANIVYMALLNPKTNIISFPYQYGDVMVPMKLGDGLTSKIILAGEPLLMNKDVTELTVQLGIQNIGAPSASYLGVPIPVGDENIGVLSVQSTEQENRFNENDLRLLSTIASSVGVALRNATLFEEVKLAKQEAEAASKLAEKANEAKSAFLSTVSHELRTPLTSVLGFAKIIKKRLEERIFPIVDKSDAKIAKAVTQVSENLQVVISEGERLTHLINDVLDLAKIEAGKMDFNQENVSMPEVAERAIAATSSLFDQKALKLIRKIDVTVPEIIGDKDKLIQVMINLISNSVKFTDTGSITCSVYQQKEELIVSITDTGIGIAPEDFGAVFEQFKQVGGDTLTDKPKGTGLGLPICKEIIEHLGGRIWLQSEPGKGSVFSFALPMQKVAKARPIYLTELVKQLKEQVAHTTLLNQQIAAPHILVVDDDDSIRSLLHQELGDAGYHIEEARNGKEALEKVRTRRPDLIILDIMMPEMNGFDAAAILKNDPQTMDIPIIVLSVVEDKARGFRIGIDRYLNKPIDTNLLFSEIGSLLEQGKSKKKVMIVDEDSGAVNTLTEVLQTKGYEVMESSENELMEKAVANLPDIIIISAGLSGKQDIVKTLRFEKGLENVLFVVYQ